MEVKCSKCKKVLAILPDTTIVSVPLVCEECHSKDVGPHNHDEECVHQKGKLCRECVQNKR